MTSAEIEALPEVARLTARLCEIPSPSGDEGEIARVVTGMLQELGAEVSEDDAADRTDAGCGNILARFPATAEGGVPILFCAHLDTVPNRGPIEVELVDGHLTNRLPTILGGDDKSAVAGILTAVRTVVEEARPHAGIEVLLTPCEEVGLQGAAAFDVSQLSSAFGFVYDHTGPVGNVVTAAPSLRYIYGDFYGTAAHAGIEPEKGRSAVVAAAKALSRMPHGRIDAETTANVGGVNGGTATNVVAEHCEVRSELRSHNPDTLAQQLTATLDALTWAAAEVGVDLETRVDNVFAGYRLTGEEPHVVMAFEVLSSLGYEPRAISTGGGSDVNALILNGFPSVNLCNGMIAVHTPDERIAVETLEAIVRVTLGLIDAARAHGS